VCAIVHDTADPEDLTRTLAALERFARPAPLYVVEADADPAAALREVVAVRPGWDAIVLHAGTELGPSGLAHLAWAAHGAPAPVICHAAVAYGQDDAGPASAHWGATTSLGWEETARLALDGYRLAERHALGPHAAIHWRGDGLSAAIEEGQEAAVVNGEVPERLRGTAVRCRLVANVLAHLPEAPPLHEVLVHHLGADAADAFAWMVAKTERVEPRVLYLDGAAGRRGASGAAALRRRLTEQDSVTGEVAGEPAAAHFASRLVNERIELVHAWDVKLTESTVRAIARTLAVPIVTTDLGRRVDILDAPPAVRAVLPDAIEPGSPHRVGDHGWAIQRREGRAPGPRRVWAVADWAAAPTAGEALRGIAQHMGPTVEWFVFGAGWADLADVGPGADYLGGHLGGVAEQLDPDIVAVFGPLARGDASVLAEAWTAGLPALVPADSPLAAAVRRFGGGRIVDPSDPVTAAEQIAELLAIARTPGAAPDPAALRSPLTAAEDYRTRVYRPGPAGRATIGVVAQRGLGTTEVRTGRPARAAEDFAAATIRWVDPHDVATGADDTEYDAVVVQRASMSGADADLLIERLARRGARLVLEMDDDLVTPEARARLDGTYAPDRLDAVAAIARAADRIITSTVHLAGVMRAFAPGADVTVVENRLDPRLWFTAPGDGKPRARRRPVYVGTATHGADLALLEGVPSLVSEALGRNVEVDVVGVTAGTLPPGFRRVDNPQTHYGQFVPWLRRHARRWSVGLAPLAADPFNNSKSDLKLLEYAALGLAAVASARGPYTGAQGIAITVDDDARSWALGVASLLRGDRWRHAAASAGAFVRTHRTIDRDWVEFWVATICGTDG
jgi:hypothetical protein